MKSLIRFEDTYGLADIFYASHKYDYIDINNPIKLIEIEGNTFVEVGRTITGCFLFSEDEIVNLIILGIERVVFVFDLDNPNGIKTEIMNYAFIRKLIDNAKEQFINYGYNIEFQFIPIVYSAETLLLYQHISNRFKETNIESLVHDEDTNKFHLILLAILNKLKRYNHAKRVREFLDIDRLKEKIQLSLSMNINNVNKHTLEWILGGCKIEDNHYDIKEVEDIINEATSIFMENRDKAVDLYIRNKLINTNISFKDLLDILNDNCKNSK